MKTRLGLGAIGLGGFVLVGGLVVSACGSSDGSGFIGDPSADGSAEGSAGYGGDGGRGACNGKTCKELGWACGYTVDDCGGVTNCADEGLACAAGQSCVGGVNEPTRCVEGGAGACELCGAIPSCTGQPQKTKLTGRVISAGRADGNTGNQVGIPNAIVYILQTTKASDLPAIEAGIGAGGASCERCDDQNLGPVLVGAVTNAVGEYTLEGNIPVGKEFVLVTKSGKFRRAVTMTIPAADACKTTALPTALPANPTRLPRSMSDGLGVNLPRIAISTGRIDAIECVFEKTGIAHGEFGNPGADGAAAPRVHLYRGNGSLGAKIDDATPAESVLYSPPAAGAKPRIQNYDLVVADCEGTEWDSSFTQRASSGANVAEYVNRGGRLFASHLSASWLTNNGSAAYNAANPFGTGLGPAASWDASIDPGSDEGRGVVSLGDNRPRKSPRIQQFSEWMLREKVVTGAPPLRFALTQPRSHVASLGASSEEFVHLDQLDGVDSSRIQQFSFNTPYGAPAAAACGRVAYSGFHVVPKPGSGSGPYDQAVFPAHCEGDLTNQEKVLLYSLFDLSACVGEVPLAPICTARTCAPGSCGFSPDGCGNVLDCGPCAGPR